MSDHENLNNGVISDDDIRPIEGLREDDPEYVRDLLTRLKEEMEGIHKGEEEAMRRAHISEEHPASAADVGITPAEERVEDEEDDSIPFDLDDAPPAPIVPAPSVTPATPAPIAPTAAAHKPASAWEELTMDSMIDTLIAERRTAAASQTVSAPAPARAEAVTESLFAPIAVEPAVEEPATGHIEVSDLDEADEVDEVADEAVEIDEVAEAVTPRIAVVEEITLEDPVLEQPEAEEVAPAEVENYTPVVEAPAEAAIPTPVVEAPAEAAIPTPVVEAPAEATIPTPVVEQSTAQPKAPAFDGIWAIAAANNAPQKKRKIYRARLVLREGSAFGAVSVDAAPMPSAEPTVEPIATPYCEPATEPESIDTIGALRPQDFFIADMREENEISSLNKADEYVSRNQIESILNAYAVEKRQVSLRFILAVILSSFLLVFENLPLLGVDYSSLLGIGARVAVLLDVGLLVAVSLLATDRFREGATELFAWELGTSAITLISVFISLLVSGVALGFGIQLLLSLPAAVAVTLSIFFYRMQVRDNERTFLLLCESGDKLAAETIPAFCATEEIAVLGRRIREVVRIKKVGFVTGYFARTKEKREDYRLHTLLTLCAIGFLYLITTLCILMTKDMAKTLSLSAWLSAPLSLSVFFAARRLPFHHLVDTAEAHGTAVLGEASAEDYGKVDAIAFEDVEAFRSNDVFVHQIKLYENGRLDELLYDLAGVFSVLGGPLDAVFRVAAAELGMPSDVVLISTAPEGLEASVEGVRISLGKWAHFRTEMISPYYDSEDTYREDSGEFSIMYVAIEGVIRAKVYLKYAMNEHFEKNVRRLQRNGVRSLIRSYDPNIGDGLVAASARSTNLRVKVVRKKPEQLHDFAETRVDSGLVTSAGSRDLLYTLFMCQNYRKAVRTLAYCKAIALPLSVLASILLPLVSHTPFASVYGAAIGLFWLIPVHFISRFYFKKER